MTSPGSQSHTRQIVLVGFMGSGKSTVGAELAKRLGLSFVDLDDRIEAAAGRSIEQIIGGDGEARFREIETAELQLIVREPVQVVAVGGGAFPQQANREIIAAHCRTFWLNASFDLCWDRIQSDRRVRPLALTREAAEIRYHSRLPFYSLADIEITVEAGSSPEVLADRIADRLVSAW